MWKRTILIFTLAGFLIPIILLAFQNSLRYFQPEYIGLDSYAVLALWPSGIMTMVLHGEGWTVSTILFLTIIISINALLYALVGFVAAWVWFLITNKLFPATRIFLFTGGALLLAFVIFGVGRPTRYELPDGYRGWVVIEYRNPDCPPIRTSGIYLILEIPHSGHVCTSDPLPDNSWRLTRYEYVRADGKRKHIPSYDNHAREVWAGHIALFQTRKEGFPQQGIFVGTKAEYEKSPRMPYVSQPPAS